MRNNRLTLLIQSSILAVILLVFAILLPSHQAKVVAQIGCGGPPLYSEVDVYDPYWPTGASVKVYFKQGHFNSTQRNIMKEAFEAWESHRFVNCSLVTFNDSAYIELAEQPSTANVGSYVWITTQEFGSAVEVTRHPTTGIILATMVIGQNNISDGTLLATTKHEIGHTYYLGNCGSACPLRSSIMDVAEYDETEAGKKAHYMLRWINKKGETGPWSQTVSATITG